MKVYTIGFTKKSASVFFEMLRESGAKRLIDVRISNRSQLAGFTKKEDLEYFLGKICRMEYVHLPELAPTREMMDSYRKVHKDWEHLRDRLHFSDGTAQNSRHGAQTHNCQRLSSVQ